MYAWAIIVVTIIGFLVIKEIRRQDIANLNLARQKLDQKKRTLAESETQLNALNEDWLLAFGRFNAVDIETTGLSKAKCRIIQIAIVTFAGGRVSNTWSTYLNPGVPIPINATKVNHITDAMLASAPTFSDVMHDIRRRLDALPLVAHHLTFDTEFLVEEFARHGVTWRPTYGYCTMRQEFGPPTPDPTPEEKKFYSKRERKWVTYKVRKEPWLTLGKAMSTYNVRPIGHLHNALTDATGCGEVFVAQGMSIITSLQRDARGIERDVKLASEAVVKAENLRRRWRI